MSVDDALSMLPHDPPMLLVEQILELVPGERARTRRRADAGDWYFQGHFPGRPVVPAIALVELLAQTGGLAAHDGSDTKRSFRVAAFGPFKFPAAAGAGSVLDAEAWVERRMGALVRVAGIVTADGTTVADGSVTLAEVDENIGEESTNTGRQRDDGRPHDRTSSARSEPSGRLRRPAT